MYFFFTAIFFFGIPAVLIALGRLSVPRKRLHDDGSGHDHH